MVNKHARGFTLIELLIVLTILGILLVLGLPAYFSYQTRAKTAHGITLIAPAKMAIAVFQQAQGRFPQSNAEAGLEPPTSYVGEYVASVSVGAEGVISVQFDDASLSNGVLTFTPSMDAAGAVNWTCSTFMPHRLVPPECRN
jgi:type IV pilus assembly protein PilA